MPACPEVRAPESISVGQPSDEVMLLAQLRRVHRDLQAILAITAQMPSGKPYDAAFQQLRCDIDVLGRKFLRLSAKLLESHAPPLRKSATHSSELREQAAAARAIPLFGVERIGNGERVSDDARARYEADVT